jgi:hypothetical protein
VTLNPAPNGISLRSPLRFGVLGAAALAALVLLLPAGARAQELQPDGSDPNAAPPPPPPMPSAGQPGSATPPPPPGSTEARLKESTDKDTGVGLHFVYLQPEVGVGFASIGSVLPETAKDFRSGAGAVLGVGAGFEFIAFQLGARLRYMPTSSFNLWTVGGEFAYQPGSGRFWPRIGLGVGWATATGFGQTMCSTFCGSIDVKGVDVSLRGGVQYFLTPHWEIGGDLSLDALFLKRAGITVVDTTYEKDATSTGVAAALVGHVGYHYP